MISDGGVSRYASAEAAVAMCLAEKFQSHPRPAGNRSRNRLLMMSRRTYLHHDGEEIDETQWDANICTYLADEIGVPTGKSQTWRGLWDDFGCDCVTLNIGYVADMSGVVTHRMDP
ncbi:hypothetical protein GCM10027267_12470 [Paramicrobacterium agarici]